MFLFVDDDDFFWEGDAGAVEVDFQCGNPSNISGSSTILLAMLFHDFSIEEFFKGFFVDVFLWVFDKKDVFFETDEVSSIF